MPEKQHRSQERREQWAADIGARSAQVKRFNRSRNHVWCEFLRFQKRGFWGRGTGLQLVQRSWVARAICFTTGC